MDFATVIATAIVPTNEIEMEVCLPYQSLAHFESKWGQIFSYTEYDHLFSIDWEIREKARVNVFGVKRIV